MLRIKRKCPNRCGVTLEEEKRDIYTRLDIYLLVKKKRGISFARRDPAI